MGICCYIMEKGNPNNCFNLGKMYGYNHPESPNKFNSLIWFIQKSYDFMGYLSEGKDTFTTYELYDKAIEKFNNGILDNSDSIFYFNSDYQFGFIDGFVMLYLLDYSKYGFLSESADKKLSEYFEWRKTIDMTVCDRLCVCFT